MFEIVDVHVGGLHVVEFGAEGRHLRRELVEGCESIKDGGRNICNHLCSSLCGYRELGVCDGPRGGLHVFVELEGVVDSNAVSPSDSEMDLANIKPCSIAACAQIMCTQQL